MVFVKLNGKPTGFSQAFSSRNSLIDRFLRGSVIIQIKNGCLFYETSVFVMHLQSLLIRFLTVMGLPGTFRDLHIGKHRREA